MRHPATSEDTVKAKNSAAYQTVEASGRNTSFLRQDVEFWWSETEAVADGADPERTVFWAPVGG